MDHVRVTGQFNESHEPIMDGVAQVVQNYATWLTASRGPSHVVAPRFPGYVDESPFPVHRYFSIPAIGRPPYRIGFPVFDAAFRREIAQVPFDLVHAHCPFSSGKVALRIARERGIPLVASFHSKYRDDFNHAVHGFKPIVDYAIGRLVAFYEQADQVWTPGEGAADTLREYGFRGPIEIVRNGSDLHVAEFERRQMSRAADEELGTQPTDTVLLYVGQLVMAKNLRLLVEAMGHLKQSQPNFRLLMVGEGYARAELETISRQLGIEQNLIFLGVCYDRERLKRLYSRAALFLFPSLYDTGSLVLREAAGCGLPSLVVSNATVAEVVRDGQNGFTAANNPQAFASRIAELLANPEAIARAGAESRETIYRSWQQIVEEVSDRYDAIARVSTSVSVGVGQRLAS